MNYYIQLHADYHNIHVSLQIFYILHYIPLLYLLHDVFHILHICITYVLHLILHEVLQNELHCLLHAATASLYEFYL
jgi:hypothetical protein